MKNSHDTQPENRFYERTSIPRTLSHPPAPLLHIIFSKRLLQPLHRSPLLRSVLVYLMLRWLCARNRAARSNFISSLERKSNLPRADLLSYLLRLYPRSGGGAAGESFFFSIPSQSLFSSGIEHFA